MLPWFPELCFISNSFFFLFFFFSFLSLISLATAFFLSFVSLATAYRTSYAQQQATCPCLPTFHERSVLLSPKTQDQVRQLEAVRPTVLIGGVHDGWCLMSGWPSLMQEDSINWTLCCNVPHLNTIVFFSPLFTLPYEMTWSLGFSFVMCCWLIENKISWAF